MSVQLRLFPLPRPLLARFGNDFFKDVPREPGVYIMRGALDQILYIGQSKDLRTRLSYYKNANPDRTPRRLIRLVHSVETIAWERCPTAAAARARELELLRLHRPKFNRADTGPQFFHYIEWTVTPQSFSIQLHFDDVARPAGNCQGPIRGKMIPTFSLVSLNRLWLIASKKITRCADLPLVPKRLAQLNLAQDLDFEILIQFFRGQSPNLIIELLNAVPTAEPALRQLQEADAEILASWFRSLAEAAEPEIASAGFPE